jgi:hypothetical protein
VMRRRATLTPLLTNDIVAFASLRSHNGSDSWVYMLKSLFDTTILLMFGSVATLCEARPRNQRPKRYGLWLTKLKTVRASDLVSKPTVVRTSDQVG